MNQNKLPSRVVDSRAISRGPDFTPAFADFGRQMTGGRGAAVSYTCTHTHTQAATIIHKITHTHTKGPSVFLSTHNLLSRETKLIPHICQTFSLQLDDNRIHFEVLGSNWLHPMSINVQRLIQHRHSLIHLSKVQCSTVFPSSQSRFVWLELTFSSAATH